VSLDKVIESRIQEAMAAGAFENLQGQGQPFRFSPAEQLAGENWLGFRILQNGGMLPAWLMLAREIEDDRRRLDELDARHAEAVALAAEWGDWDGYARAIRYYRRTFEEGARALRKKQDRFNHDAPGIRSERPAIWVEYHLERLDRRLREAGAPDDVAFVLSD
jgi:hypothetical protein